MPAGSAVEYQCGPCPDGMVGDGIKCFDENECLSEPGTCNQTCINTLGSYYCECRQGFHLNEDKHSCDDIDECSHHGNRCARYARCINLPGSFDCQCLPEYHGNGFVKCIEAVKYGATLVFPYLAYQDDFENQDSDEFKELAEIIEASLNKTYKALEGFIGSKVIKFEHGSVVSHSELAFDIDTNVDISDVESALEDAIQCDGSTCYMNNEEVPGLEVDRHSSVAGDLDECVLGIDDCHPLSTICINLNGTFTCECRDGWRPYSLPKMCEDIDECAETLNCTAPNTVCVNKPGSFACNCQASHMGDPLSAEGCSSKYTSQSEL
ncbi:fibulin-1-like [Ptychodera flava]|uniref:fibulin-1-like n=1 Tax=Ptychodera flava TaxID=63121 RepID=UPI00396A82D7